MRRGLTDEQEATLLDLVAAFAFGFSLATVAIIELCGCFSEAPASSSDDASTSSSSSDGGSSDDASTSSSSSDGGSSDDASTSSSANAEHCASCCSPYQGATLCEDPAVDCVCVLEEPPGTFYTSCCAGGSVWAEGCITAAQRHCALDCEGC